MPTIKMTMSSSTSVKPASRSPPLKIPFIVPIATPLERHDHALLDGFTRSHHTPRHPRTTMRLRRQTEKVRRGKDLATLSPPERKSAGDAGAGAGRRRCGRGVAAQDH